MLSGAVEAWQLSRCVVLLAAEVAQQPQQQQQEQPRLQSRQRRLGFGDVPAGLRDSALPLPVLAPLLPLVWWRAPRRAAAVAQHRVPGWGRPYGASVPGPATETSDHLWKACQMAVVLVPGLRRQVASVNT
mmetsp:Transcript_81455/g.204966  ORF Transcript_81455/g.204966 Transcript_81455/m.204966 type:complete len:131 (-) Transcript_81455:3-395(-)